ncbi:hypothetical protein PILCRDRAFT_16343 [Piloderma croceum F 1598]|uniref:Zn(2)-C6 fungal-type domain-containing protein n=1 Tax=Piloderma croceum (strain F 1598) TaxID=765440 RepID=A0A0C3EW56_PILCF|nr:hypothetical protein PILCRDRAFT_16343 [Piloderma croceum F 1598]
MNIDTFPPQSTVTSKPLVPVPAQFLLRRDVLDKNEPQPRYQDHYSPDAYFPPADSLWSLSERSSSFQELQNPNGMSNALQVWGTAVATEIAQPQTPSMTMPVYPTPFFFQAPSSPRDPPTIYGRMASPASRQRTIQACTNCRERKTKCSGKRPACQRCYARGLICHYANVSTRETKLRNIPRVRHRTSHLSSHSSAVADPIDKAPLVRISPAIIAPQPVRPPIITSMSNTLSRVAISERWIPSMQPMLYHLPHPEYPKETGSALGLTGVFTKTPSTITPGLAPQELTLPATKDAAPMMTSMFDQYLVTPPTNFNQGQHMSWDYQSLEINSYRYEPLSATTSNNSSASSNANPSPPSSSIPSGQYMVPFAESPIGVVNSSGSSPASSHNSSSPSSAESTAPSSVALGPTSDLPTTKSPSLLTSTGQAQYFPGEDFSFMTDPAYYEDLVKSTMADGNVGKENLQRSLSAAESMTLQYP